MAYGNTFRRGEIKFILNEEQYNMMLSAISDRMTEDKYGKHTICNIYCDTDDWRLIRTSIEKPKYKEKLRLRCYGTPNDSSITFIEIKKKFKGIVYKRRVQLTYKEAFNYINNGIKPDIHSQQLDEIDYMISYYGLKPKIVICYDRRAFFGNEDNEFRMTFDTAVRSRTDALDLRNGDYGSPLTDDGHYVMEVKAAGGVPLWLVKILSENNIYKQSFSKYGNIYIRSLLDIDPSDDTDTNTEKEEYNV